MPNNTRIYLHINKYTHRQSLVHKPTKTHLICKCNSPRRLTGEEKIRN